jgi:hypothetical protein
MATNGNLVPHDDEELKTSAPTPQDWGLPQKPSLAQLQCWDNQQRFLRRYAERGKLSLSAGDCGFHPATVERWQRMDLYGFNKRLEYAFQPYRETQEQLNEEWVNETKHNSQIYRIFHMKAIWPEKYREDAKPQSNSDSRQLLDKLTEMARKEIAERERLEAESTEAEYRELGEQDEN